MQMIIVGKGITAWLRPQKEHMLHNILSHVLHREMDTRKVWTCMNQVRMKMLNA